MSVAQQNNQYLKNPALQREKIHVDCIYARYQTFLTRREMI
jgi:hypothetical protein